MALHNFLLIYISCWLTSCFFLHGRNLFRLTLHVRTKGTGENLRSCIERTWQTKHRCSGNYEFSFRTSVHLSSAVPCLAPNLPSCSQLPPSYPSRYPMNEVLLPGLTVAHQVKELLAFSESLDSLGCSEQPTTSLHLQPDVSIPHSYFKINFNIILPSTRFLTHNLWSSIFSH